ncbi:diaminohydroxyphosphoribosylaminopyrimidine deaminase / 5-amino-6-(5-phosphoribosylamino)uracil reductase [Limimonas halophila]|uniref:Riboflavin biosynthesis protein RibD n=2 Tax=Limimonas halophila TaxID=1082479 RepID=A0A1G7NVT1_9PROT|nr:diaminohydroxyphosphoribosylaminopyrimidine deaminase / 5-amino-6-(5-phosphoribosylamino)uracil reductase [Limimonas halophila]
MGSALALAQRALGRVAPNPAVGCVLVRDGRAIARGWTQPGGRPHAEQEALRHAGSDAAGATAYVTLEPCDHHGTTPPCSEALIAAGVSRCVVAMRDPDERVAGHGIARLRDAGIEVVEGVRDAEAAALNAGYVRHRREGRPEVTLKLATTLDGRIATRTGESQWITGPEARSRAHLERARHDAVLVGSGTAARDDPRLTVRLGGGAARQPTRVVLDSRLRLPLTHALVRDAHTVPTVVLTRWDAPSDRTAALNDAGVSVAHLAPDDDGEGTGVSLTGALAALGSRGLTRVLVEGGGRLAGALMRADLVDRLIWFRAPSLIGGDGVPAIAGAGVTGLDAVPTFRQTSTIRVGGDTMETHERVRESGCSRA